MKRIILFTFLGLLIAQATWAKLRVTKEPDGTVVLTLEATGDIAAEISGKYDPIKPGSELLTKNANTASKIKVVTINGAKLNTADFEGLCGLDNSANYHRFSAKELDLTDADAYSQEDLKHLGYMPSLKKVTYPKSTTRIPQTFLNSSNSQVEEVIIPDNPNIDLKIDNQAFQNQSLREISIGARKKIQIDRLCFQGNPNLTTVDFHYGSTNIVIGDKAFDRCTGLKNIVLPEGVTEIGDGAFLNSGITSIRLPQSLQRIKTKAFAGCTELKSITIPEGVEEIETAAFENNYNLSDVYVLGTHTKCAEGAFTDNNTYQYTIQGGRPNGTTVSTDTYFKPEDRNMKVVTKLHFKEAAYDNYTNEFLKVIGTQGYGSSPYKDHSELNNWVFDDKGNKFPQAHSSYFEGTKGDYAGWKNFLATDKTLDKHIYEDKVHVRDKWYTLCLPFDMTETELKSAYGATVEVVEFSEVTGETKMTSKGKDKYITFKFKDRVTQTKAHHPYMIHPAIHAGKTQGVKTVIVGIDLQPEDDARLQSVVKTWDGVTYIFRGNYTDGKKLQPYSYYYYSGDDETKWPNAFYKWGASEGGTWTKYTACILASKDDHARAKAFTAYGLTELDDVTNGINDLNAIQPAEDKMAADGKVYNLNGQVVRASTDSLSTLPKGIYIVNGKKYSVR
ncbi:MAG: leucine-rich repeat domain-containing protein [Prevotella sp.]|nr:leucine-rich repeat domain-containing protein [Prevotella sp.]